MNRIIPANAASHQSDKIRSRLGVVSRITAFTIPGHLIWEFAQLPLYTLWYTDSWSRIAFAVIHCTGGDVLIMAFALAGALFLVGGRAWPRKRYVPVAIGTVVLSVAYTIFSEWNSTVISKAWTYSELMPTLPFLGTGLSPLLQWIAVPALVFWLSRQRTIIEKQD